MNSQLRITSGSVKNKRLKAPNIEGYKGIQEKAKLAAFSILADKVTGAVVLDLFAGSGNMGLEALSRGAKWCDFVDVQKNSVRTIEENVKNCGFESISEVSGTGSVKFASNTMKKYNIVFMDPFYEDTAHTFLFKNLEEILEPNGTIMYFHGLDPNFDRLLGDTKIGIVDTRRFGKSFLTTLCVSA